MFPLKGAEQPKGQRCQEQCWWLLPPTGAPPLRDASTDPCPVVLKPPLSPARALTQALPALPAPQGGLPGGRGHARCRVTVSVCQARPPGRGRGKTRTKAGERLTAGADPVEKGGWTRSKGEARQQAGGWARQPQLARGTRARSQQSGRVCNPTLHGAPLLLPFQVALGSEMLRNQLQVTQPMREQLPQSPTGVGAAVKAARRKGWAPALRALSG